MEKITDLINDPLFQKIFFVGAAILILFILIAVLVSSIKLEKSVKESKPKKNNKHIRPIINIYFDKDGNMVAPTQPIVVQVVAPTVAPAAAPVAPAPVEVKPEPVVEPAPAPAPVEEKPEPVVEPAPVEEKPEPVVEEPVVEEVPEAKAKLPYGEKVEFEVKLNKAPEETQAAFKELVTHLQTADPKIHTFEAKFHVCIKYLSYKLCEFKFVRSYLRASFFVSSPNSKKAEDANASEEPTVITLDGKDSLATCLKLADTALAQAKAAKKAKRK